MTPIETLYIALGIIVTVGTLISMSAIGVKWLVKNYLGEIKQELKPNGGGSIKDHINELTNRQTKDEALGKETYLKVEKLDRKLDDLYDKFIEYLTKDK